MAEASASEASRGPSAFAAGTGEPTSAGAKVRRALTGQGFGGRRTDKADKLAPDCQATGGRGQTHMSSNERSRDAAHVPGKQHVCPRPVQLQQSTRGARWARRPQPRRSGRGSPGQTRYSRDQSFCDARRHRAGQLGSIKVRRRRDLDKHVGTVSRRHAPGNRGCAVRPVYAARGRERGAGTVRAGREVGRAS